MQELKDRTMVCKECLKDFPWTVGEQKYLWTLFEQGKIKDVFEPQICKRCKIERRKRNQ